MLFIQCYLSKSFSLSPFFSHFLAPVVAGKTTSRSIYFNDYISWNKTGKDWTPCRSSNITSTHSVLYLISWGRALQISFFYVEKFTHTEIHWSGFVRKITKNTAYCMKVILLPFYVILISLESRLQVSANYFLIYFVSKHM